MKVILKSFVVVFLLGLLWLMGYSQTLADQKMVESLISKADHNEQAKLLVGKFLSNHQTPTVSQVIEKKLEVEKILVAEISNKAASDAGVKPVEKDVEVQERDADPLLPFWILIYGFIIFFGISLTIMRL